MAYFPNGTAGMDYMERYCMRCQNWRANESGSEGCPIMDAHAFANYDQFKNDNLRAVLSILIPRAEDKIYNDQCSMFLEKSA